MTVGRSIPGCRLVLLAVALAPLGCDSGAFVPPRPAELSGGTVSASAPSAAGAAGPSAALSATARPLELVFPPTTPTDADNLKIWGRSMAGAEKMRAEVAVAGDGGQGEAQPALVRKAAARQPAALIVDPVDPADPELARAVAEARGQGVPVVVMRGPLTTPAEPKPAEGKPAPGTASGRLVTVLPDPFSRSAPELVEAALNNARNIGFGADIAALVMTNDQTDSLGGARIEALRSALREAKVGTILEGRFPGDIASASSVVVERVQSNPKVGIVLSNDHVGLTASFQAMNTVGDSRPYVVAGYTSDESSATMTRSGEFAGTAIYSAERLLRKAVATAAALVRGEKVPDRVELMVPVFLSPKDSGAPQMYRTMGSRRPESQVPDDATPDPRKARTAKEPAKRP